LTASTAGTAPDYPAELLHVINDGMLSLMLSIGFRTGLFEAMARLPASTAAEVASEARLAERYVREWLTAMVLARVLNYDATTGRFCLPPEHVDAVTWAGGPANMACLAQHVAVLGQMEDKVVECFKHGGGLVPDDYPDRLTAVSEEDKLRAEDDIVTTILPEVPGIVQRLQDGIDVLDVGCGTGHEVIRMAREFPTSRFAGLDIDRRALEAARQHGRRLGLTNVRFVEHDAATLDGSEHYDFILTFDAVHDQARPDLVLAGIARSLRPGGTYLCIDIGLSSTLGDNLDHPGRMFISAFSTMYCVPISLAYAGVGLGAMWGTERTLQMLSEAGFSTQVVHLEGNWNNFYVSTLT
jgi:SAM-dependent methyltransferase